MGASQLRMSSRPPMPAGVPGASGSGGLRSRQASLARAVAPLALAILLVGAPQWLGGIYPSAMIGIACASGVCLGLALLSVRSGDLPRGLLLAVALVPLAWTALQVTPLPCGIVETLSPLSAARLREVYALFGLPKPTHCFLTRDPGASREEVIKGFAIAGAMLSAAMLAASGRQRWVFSAVGISTLLMAAVTFGHAAVGAERVFGIYEPVELRNMRFIAPLLNPNNLGGFLAMGIPVLIGLALEQSSARARIALLVSVGAVAATALMTRSRGAAGAVALGPCVYALLALWRSRSRGSRREQRVRQAGPRWLRTATPLAVCGVLGLTGYAWFDELAAEFASSGWDKIDLIKRAATFSMTVPWVGVGRGGFSGAFVGTLENHYRFDYAESLLVQWAVDWGIPLACALTVALAVLYVRAVQQTRSHARIGALAGVATVFAQNLVDLGLELTGPAVVAAALLGACVSFPPEGSRAQRGTAHTRVLRVLCAAIAVLSIAVPVAQASWLVELHGPSVEQRLTLLASERDRHAFATLTQRGMLDHPSEPMLPILAAHEALVARDPRAGRFINRGMVLAPGWAAPHVQAAQWLWNRKLRRQALLELRAAAELELPAINAILCPMARADARGVIAVAPKGFARSFFLDSVVRCLPGTSPEGRAVDDEMRRTIPDFAEPHMREARRLLEEKNVAQAVISARTAVTAEPTYAAAIDLLAQALTLNGKHNEAYSVLDAGLAAGADPAVLHERRARVATAARDAAAMRASLGALRGWLGASDAQRLAYTYQIEGSLEHHLGNFGAALHAYNEAFRLGGLPNALNGIAVVSEQLGDWRRAQQAWRGLCELQADPKASGCVELERLRKKGASQPPLGANP